MSLAGTRPDKKPVVPKKKKKRAIALSDVYQAMRDTRTLCTEIINDIDTVLGMQDKDKDQYSAIEKSILADTATMVQLANKIHQYNSLSSDARDNLPREHVLRIDGATKMHNARQAKLGPAAYMHYHLSELRIRAEGLINLVNATIQKANWTYMWTPSHSPKTFQRFALESSAFAYLNFTNPKSPRIQDIKIGIDSLLCKLSLLKKAIPKPKSSNDRAYERAQIKAKRIAAGLSPRFRKVSPLSCHVHTCPTRPSAANATAQGETAGDSNFSPYWQTKKKGNSGFDTLTTDLEELELSASEGSAESRSVTLCDQKKYQP